MKAIIKQVLLILLITELNFVCEQVQIEQLGQNLSQYKISKVYLLTHQWCRKCDNVNILIQKLKLNMDSRIIQNNKFHQFQVQIINNYDDKYNQQKKNKGNPHILQNQNALRDQISKYFVQINIQNLPFPTILLNCPNFKGIYQNQINYKQLVYWINIYCFNIIQSCKIKTTERQLYVSITKQLYLSQLQYIVNKQTSNSLIKFCIKTQHSNSSQTLLQQKQSVKKIALNIQSSPLFIDSFTHNLRDYLYKSQKIGIFLMFQNPNNNKVKQFIDIFKFLHSKSNDKQDNINIGILKQIFGTKHKINQKDQYIKSEYQSGNLNYQFKYKEALLQRLVFITGCSQKHRKQCVHKYQYSTLNKIGNHNQLDKNPSIQTINISISNTKPAMIKKLLQFTSIYNPFLNVNKQKLYNSDPVKLVAVKFDRNTHQLTGFQFNSIQPKLSYQFLFWLQQVYQHFAKNQHQAKFQTKQSTKCISNQLSHIISNKNLTSLQNNVIIKRFFENRENEIKYKDLRLKTVIGQKPQDYVQVSSLGGLTWSSQIFRLCLTHKNIKYYTNFQQVMTKLNQHFSPKQQNQL